MYSNVIVDLIFWICRFCHLKLPRGVYNHFIHLCTVFLYFHIQVAVYTRQQLNIRITTNFLLALAANQPSTKPHVRRYFRAAVQLPSDWLEVVRIYSTVRESLVWINLCISVMSGPPSSNRACLVPVLQPLSANVPEEGNG